MEKLRQVIPEVSLQALVECLLPNVQDREDASQHIHESTIFADQIVEGLDKSLRKILRN